jgi:predicted metal-binding membrane protein
VNHDLAGFALMWAAMSLIMMVPTVLRPTARVARGSRARAAAFLLGYIACWLAVGIPAFALTGLAMGSTAALLACWGLVGLWQMLPSTSALLRKCQGLNAASPALLLGVRQGGWCVGSCWLLMIATMATVDRFALPLAAGIAVMAGVAAFIMWQKSPRASAQSIRLVGVAVVIATVVLYATGLAEGGAIHDMATMSSPALA